MVYRFVAGLLLVVAAGAQANTQKPNILVIWGDDIGAHNISAYNHGVMGYETPNIDRIAKEGAMFTHYYAQQSCTAGRASGCRVRSRAYRWSADPFGTDVGL